MPAAIPENDEQRVRALHDLDILDTLPEQVYDELALLAARICGTPIALVSLVDAERQWFKAKVGLEASQTHRDLAFCGHAILEPDAVFSVHDAQADHRFATSELVTGAPGIRAYAGAPIVMESGDVLGTVCVIDTAPRTLTAEQTAALQALARQAAGQLELRRMNLHLEAVVAARTKDLQAALVAAEAAGRVKSAFVSAMSHEVRTPLNGVMGMIDVLEQGQLVGPQKEAARMARESARALLRIVDDVLDFSKIEAGSISVDDAPMSIERVVAQVRGALAPSAEARGVSLDVQLDPGLPAKVRGDAARLRQVLLNLVENAIKFSSGKGRDGIVDVRVALADRDAERCRVEMRVTDNGIGMDPATQARLFVPFTQADAGTTKQFGGAGLGLTISHRLAGLMGGSIAVESRPGVGSSFTLQLPFRWFDDDDGPDVEPVPPTAAPPLRDSEAARAGRAILVAEDNEMNQQVIRQQLSIMGLSADIAETGQVALDLWSRGHYVLLLTDLHMPVMDGFELISRIRASEPPERRLPIVALTADASEAASTRCRQLGADECLTKPLSLANMHALLKRRMPAHVQPLPLRT